ncbi:MAG: hypothetical protein ABSF26_15990 [Thermoguttaceae bacterium]|jgi:hypothetical protein
MTDDWRLPPELERLARDLAGRPRVEPPPGLKPRVMHGLRADLKRQPPGVGWAFPLAAAAAALVWLNLSLAATRATDYGLRPAQSGPPVAADSRQIEQLLIELSPEEARRQAILLRAGATLVPCPNLAGGRSAVAAARSFLPDE